MSKFEFSGNNFHVLQRENPLSYLIYDRKMLRVRLLNTSAILRSQNAEHGVDGSTVFFFFFHESLNYVSLRKDIKFS